MELNLDKFNELEIQNKKVFKTIIDLLKLYKQLGMTGKMNIYDLIDNLINTLEKWA